MTTLKFRVWDKENKEMLFVRQIDFMFGKVVLESYEQFFIDEIELMQSTGLFDMYDKEIFEGDVLQTHDGELSKVVWNKYLGCWEVKFLSEIVDLSEVADVKSNRSDCEIVGNIYENPEFLEGEMEETHVELLEAQLAIGKAVIESMLELIPKKGTEMAVIPVTIEGYEFEVEVRMK